MRFTTKVLLYKFFDDFIIIYPLYTVMFSDYGVSPIQISVLLAVWSGTSMLLEIPSGVLADLYSRKSLLIVAQIIRLIGYIIWLVFPNFVGFLIGFILWGIKSALTSGTFQALIYDELHAKNQQDMYTNILGKTKSISFVAILLASVISSIAIHWGYGFIMVLSITSLVLSFCSLLLIRSTPKVESTGESKYLEILNEGFLYIRQNTYVLQLLIFLSLAFALGGALDEFWTLFAKDLGAPEWGLGLFLGTMSVAQVFGNSIVSKFEKTKRRSVYLIFILNGILLVLASYIFNIFSLGLLVIFSFAFTIIQTVYEGKLQHNIPSKTRATISSVNGFIVELFVLIVYFTTGYISENFSYRISFYFWGILIILIGLIYLLFQRTNYKTRQGENETK